MRIIIKNNNQSPTVHDSILLYKLIDLLFKVEYDEREKNLNIKN